MNDKTPAYGARSGLRRRLLHDMGIEVWYIRAEAQKTAVGHAAEPASNLSREDAPTDPPSTGQPLAVGMPSVDVEPDVSNLRGPSTAPPPARAADPPYTVVAHGAPGVLLVVDALEGGGGVILARDIVRAVCRDWAGAVGQARFDWPQPGASGASAPALAAFIEKQVEDYGAKRLLIAESTASRLGDDADDFIRVPDLPSLGDAEAKSQLWRLLRGLTP